MTADKNALKGEDTAAEVSGPRPDGWDLLKPANEVPAWDQAELMATMSPLAKLVSGKWKSDDPRALRAMAAMARALLMCAADQAAYTEFVSGPGGLNRVVDLASAYTAELAG